MASGTALVTGASAGIGREFCRQLAAAGYDLILVARDADRLAALASELGARHGVTVAVLAADLTRDADVDRIVARIADTPALTLLVNNAGFGTTGGVATAPPEGQEAMIRLHVLTPMRLTRAALRGFLARRQGAIVSVSSIAGFTFSAGSANYCATKAYLTTFSEGLAAELVGTGVRAQALCPGFTRTEFHRRMGPGAGDRPRLLWMSAESVVRASLAALKRGRPVVCVPGFRYKLIVALVRLMPRQVLALLSARRFRRV
ncbi:MAG: SDR family oxidoreductase [Gemmatimonadales bacterium]